MKIPDRCLREGPASIWRSPLKGYYEKSNPHTVLYIYRNLECKYNAKYEIECEIIFRGNKNTQQKPQLAAILDRLSEKNFPYWVAIWEI